MARTWSARATSVNRKPAVWHDGELRITELPADVVVDRQTEHIPERTDK